MIFDKFLRTRGAFYERENCIRVNRILLANFTVNNSFAAVDSINLQLIKKIKKREGK
jgi:hypothetical protein